MNEKYIIGIGLLLVFLAIALMTPISISQTKTDQGLQYGSMVCVYKNNKLVGSCKHNLFTDWGKNWTRDLIGNWDGGGTAMKYIATANDSTQCQNSNTLGSAETPDAAWDTYRPAGTYTVVQSSPGNWTISAVLTAQEAINGLNATGLFNVTTSGSGTHFACNNFTSVNLLANDQLNITWYIWVT